MTGRILYLICDACRKTALNDPDMEIVQSGAPLGYDWHICADCTDADWFWCKPCKKAHQCECPVEAAKADAEYLRFQVENAEAIAAAKAHDAALPF